MIDTLKLSKRLQEASIPKDQAEALAEGLEAGMKESYVTKEDLDLTIKIFKSELQRFILMAVVAVALAEIIVLKIWH